MAVVDRYLHQNKKVVAFKPIMDDRYSDVEIRTHSGASLEAVGVNCGKDVLEHIQNVESSVDVIAVDEAFMIEGISKALLCYLNPEKLLSSLHFNCLPACGFRGSA